MIMCTTYAQTNRECSNSKCNYYVDVLNWKVEIYFDEDEWAHQILMEEIRPHSN